MTCSGTSCPPLPGSHADTLDGYLYVFKVQKDQFDTVADALPLRYHSGISPTAQSRLKSKTPLFSHVEFHFFNHHAPCPNSRGRRLKRCQPGGNKVRIDKHRASRLFGQKFARKGRLAGPVRTSNYDDSSSLCRVIAQAFIHDQSRG
jgi:hypothetical protein